jgi:hypothetical protein
MFYVVALYPVLLMARFQPDDVVHYGFLRWIAVVLVLYWAALQLFFSERPTDTRPGRQTLAVTAGILLVLGAFQPIVSFPFIGDVDFFREGYGDGYILLAMAGLSIALAVTGRWKQVLVPGLGSLAVVLWTFLSVQDTISQARSGAPATLAGNPHEGLAASVMQSIQWEWGWLFLFAGSGLLVYSAARRDPMEAASEPFAPMPVEDEPAAAPVAASIETTTQATADAPAEPTAEEADDETRREAEAPTVDTQSESAAEVAEPAAEVAEPAAEMAEPAAEVAEPAAEVAEPAAEAAPDTDAEQPATAAAEEPESAADPAPAVEPAEEEATASEAGETGAEPDSAAATADSAEPDAAADSEPAAAGAEAEPAAESAPSGSADSESADASSESDRPSAEAPPASGDETGTGESEQSETSDSASADTAKKE